MLQGMLNLTKKGNYRVLLLADVYAWLLTCSIESVVETIAQLMGQNSTERQILEGLSFHCSWWAGKSFICFKYINVSVPLCRAVR
jgi:hypothetical protein